MRLFAHLLRATNDWVFVDSDSIRAGKKWRQKIDNAISAASLMIVFWCEHAAKSEEEEGVVGLGSSLSSSSRPVKIHAWTSKRSP